MVIRRRGTHRYSFWKSLTEFAFGEGKRSRTRLLDLPPQLRIEHLEERRLLSVSTLSIPQSLAGQVGQTITVPVDLEVTQSGGFKLNGADIGITYDSTKFSVSNARRAPTLISGGFSAVLETSTPGILKFTASSGGGVTLPEGFSDSLFLVDFTILSGAGSASPVDLEQSISGLTTALFENVQSVTLSPAPTNSDNDSVDGLITIQAANTAPTAEAGGPYTVSEGSTVSLSAAGSTDVEQSAASLTYEWDLDGDNTFGETGGAAGRGDEIGINPTFNAAGVSGPATVTVKLRAVDDGGLSSVDTAIISVTNVAPTSDAGGPYTVAEGATISLTGSGTDPVDAITFTWDLDGDGIFGEVGQSIGSEILVNSYTTSFQEQPAVAIAADGHFIVVWNGIKNENGQEGSSGVYAQLFEANGSPIGSEFRVNTYTHGNQGGAFVAMSDDGDFVVTWSSMNQDGGAWGAYAQRFSADGTALGSEFRVHTTTGMKFSTGIGMDADGDFLICWNSYGQDGSQGSAYARRYSADGTPIGSEFRVNTYTTGMQWEPDIAMNGDGDFVITWQSANQDGSNYGIYAQRYNASGAPQGGEFRVNTYTTNVQTQPQIAIDGDGNFIIAWQSLNQDGSSTGVYARYFSASGTPQGYEFLVNTETSNAQGAPVLSMNSEGEAIIAWQSNAQDGNSYGVYAKSYSPAIQLLGREFRVNTHTTSTESKPAVASNAAGQFVVTWMSDAQDGDRTGIVAQRGGDPQRGAEIGQHLTFNAATISGPTSVTVTLRVTDADGASTSATRTIQVTNVAPTANAGGPYTIAEGATISLTGSGTDPVDALTYTWDLDRDGTYGETGATATHGNETGTSPVYTAVGISGPQNATVRLKVTDSNGAATTATTVIAITNVAPSASAVGPFTVDEGSTIGISGTGTDVTDGISLTWDLDGDGTFGETGAAATRGPEVAPTTATFNTAPDGVTGATLFLDNIQYTFAWNVGQSAYSMNPGNQWVVQRSGQWVYKDAILDEYPMGLPTTSHPFYKGAAFWDGAWPAKGWDLEFGTGFVDGRPTENSAVVFSAAGLSGPTTVTATLRVTDANGASTISTTTIQVTNVAPTANAGGPYTVAEGATTDLAGTGTDPADAVTLTWDLDGDGLFGEVGTISSDFRVNTITTGTKEHPVMAGSANGDFVVVWRNGMAYARLFNSDGTAKGPQFKVSTEPSLSEYHPTVAMNDSGSFVVTYAQPGAQANHQTIAAQRFNASGVRVGLEILVSETEGFFQLDNDVAIDPEGNFVVVWTGADKLVDLGYGVYARRVAADGTPLGSEFLVNTITEANQNSPSVAIDATGNFVISWSDAAPGHNGIYAQRYSSDGTPQGVNFKVHTLTVDNRALSSVGMDANGNFVIAWEQWFSEGSVDNDIYARRFESSGVPLGIEFLVPSYSALGQGAPDVEMTADGQFVVAWTDVSARDGSSRGIFARKFNANGTPNGNDFPLNTITTGAQDEVTVSIDAQGKVTAAWKGPDGATTGMYTRATSFGARGDEVGSNPVFDASKVSGPAAVTVTLRVTDANGAATTSTTTVAVTSVAPTANAGGPYTLAEGATLALSGTGSDPVGPLTFSWDLDGDGTFGETGGAAVRGSETGVKPVYSASGLSAPFSSSITLRVTDVAGVSTQATSTVSVTLASLRVTSLTPTSTGFTAQFNQALDPSGLNLYDQGGVLGATDVTLVGATSGAVRGSLLVDPGLRSITFIKSGGVLSPDTYTVGLESNSLAFKDTLGGLLDGNSDLIAGDDYLGNFTIGAPSTNAVTLSIPDFARGFGQSVNLPVNQAVGIPIILSSGKNISGVDFQLEYDPALLSISNVTVGGVGASLQFNNTTPGRLILTVNSASELSSSLDPITLVNVIATVPTSAPYGAKQLLNLTNIHAFDSSNVPAEVPSIDNDGVHVAAYFGDANGSQTYNSPDATLAQRMIVGTIDGLLAYQLVDPHLIVDITGNDDVQSNDVTLIQRAIVGTPIDEIPPHPGLAFEAPTGPDPLVYIPQNLSGSVGESISVPVELLVTEPSGVTLAGVDLAVSFDPTRLALSVVQVGQLLVGFGLNANTSTPGILRLSLSSHAPLSLPFDASGTLVTLHFTILAGAGTSSSINLLAESQSLHTALYDELGAALTLVPAPTNEETDLVDGRVRILSDDE